VLPALSPGEVPVALPAIFPACSPQQQVTLLHKQVPVLCPATIFKAQDQHLEIELNERVGFVIHQTMSDSDSSESFVDATQNQPNNASSSNVSVDQSQTPERIRQDIEFLKQSWANMAEEDEDNQRVLVTTDAAIVATDAAIVANNDGFQVSLSKHQKKALKKMSHSSRDSYITRSKVSPKPFK
jgi:hypothetical protein